MESDDPGFEFQLCHLPDVCLQKVIQPESSFSHLHNKGDSTDFEGVLQRSKYVRGNIPWWSRGNALHSSGAGVWALASSSGSPITLCYFHKLSRLTFFLCKINMLLWPAS